MKDDPDFYTFFLDPFFLQTERIKPDVCKINKLSIFYTKHRSRDFLFILMNFISISSVKEHFLFSYKFYLGRDLF